MNLKHDNILYGKNNLILKVQINIFLVFTLLVFYKNDYLK